MTTTLFKSSKLHLALVAALGVTLAACGGNSSGGGVAALTGVSKGIAVDGTLSGATACLDQNDNTICDTGEATSPVTKGAYSFPSSLGAHLVIVTGGTDDTTGAAFTGVLKAPAGATTASPLTTLLVNNPGLSATTLASSLGLTGVNLLTTDPTTNNTLLAAGTAVQQLINQISATLAAATGASLSSIQTLVAQQVANQSLASLGGLTTSAGASTLVSSVMNSSAIASAVSGKLSQTALQTLATNSSAAIGTTVQQIATANSVTLAGLAIAGANATSNVATTTTLGGGLTNIVAGAGVFVNGVQATAAVAGGIKSVSTAAGSGVQTATLNFGAITGVLGISNPISVALDVSSTTLGDNRSLQAAITGLTLNNNASGVLSITATSGVTAATAYGRNTAGTTANITSTNSTTISSWFSPVAASAANVGGGIQLNVGTMLALFTTSTNPNAAIFGNLTTLKGTFNVKLIVSGVNSIANSSGVALIPAGSIAVTGAAPATTVSGQGETIAVTVN